MIIDIGIFAYNEADKLPNMLSELVLQDIFQQPNMDVRVHLLANGCVDATVPLAQSFQAQHAHLDFVLHDDPQGGKSRTWNRFVHEFSRPEAKILIFCDADIRLPQRTALTGLAYHLDQNPTVLASSSRPVKDIQYDQPAGGLIAKMIAAGGDTLGDWKTAICGQLYAARAEYMQRIYMPIGLPVEDGFLRAMIATNLMQEPPDLGRLSAPADVFHVYESERSINSLVKHQVRIVIGSSINKQAIEFIQASSFPEIVLKEAATDPTWLVNRLKERLPTATGWVSQRFLFKRLRKWKRSPTLKKLPVAILGFCFDAVVYLIAQIKMARGTGAGHW